MERLSALAPVSDAYATLPVADAFTWSTAGIDEVTGEWYLVAFRSIRREGADEDRLRAYDDRAHEEAAASPGFVFYYKGPAAPDRSCMSFCLWGSRAEARAAAGRPAHREAITVLGEMYESYRLEFLRVQRREPWGPLEFEPYDPAPQTAVA
jgi:hypothetical protein